MFKLDLEPNREVDSQRLRTSVIFQLPHLTPSLHIRTLSPRVGAVNVLERKKCTGCTHIRSPGSSYCYYTFQQVWRISSHHSRPSYSENTPNNHKIYLSVASTSFPHRPPFQLLTSSHSCISKQFCIHLKRAATIKSAKQGASPNIN